MSGVELGLAIVGVLHVCYTCGRELVNTIQAFREADTRLVEFVVRVEACWVRIEVQLEVVEKLAPLLNERHRDVQQQTLEVLLGKLRVANSKLSGLRKAPSPHWVLKKIKAKQFNFAIARDSLSEAILDLDTWKAVFDPSWYLMIAVANPEIDNQLNAITKGPAVAQKEASASIPAALCLRRALNATDGKKPTVFLPPNGLVEGSIKPIAFSPSRTARRADTDQIVILDPITCTSRPLQNAVLRDICNFAKRLRHADPFTFGLLECKGILRDRKAAGTSHSDASSPPNFSFVFRLPATHASVQSLRGRLLSRNAHDSLSERFALAQQLVRAVAYVHIYGFVHKNVRPENILLLRRGEKGMLGNIGPGTGKEGSELLETAALVGFDVLRDAEGGTHRLGDDDWEKNLYRHPSRQGRTPEVDYEMRHDIYSLGVCLLEIGLWQSFIGDGAAARNSNTIGEVLECSDETEVMLFKDPSQVAERLLRVARVKLRRRMGTKYGKVVETCLTCLDEGNEDFGNEEEFQDGDGVAVGVRYIEKVVAKLGEIAV